MKILENALKNHGNLRFLMVFGHFRARPVGPSRRAKVTMLPNSSKKASLLFMLSRATGTRISLKLLRSN